MGKQGDAVLLLLAVADVLGGAGFYGQGHWLFVLDIQVADFSMQTALW